MSRLVHAAKHYGCPKKRYKFEMHIHRVVLTSEKRKLFTRVLWSRGKKKHKSSHNPPRFKTKWCEGVENYNINESIFDEATIYFTSNTNQIQSKQTKITLQIRERIDGKDVKFAKFALDLSKYVDLSSPHRIFYQRLNYEKARKKAQLIFTIKSMEIQSDGSTSDYTDNEDDDDDESHSNYTDYNTDDDESVLTVANINTIVNKNQNQTKNTKNANIAAIHSNISGNKLKTRYFDHKNQNKTKIIKNENSPSPSESNKSNVSAITITRRNGHEKFQRINQFTFNDKNINITPKHRIQSSGSNDIDIIGIPNTPTTMSSSASDIDIRELQRKLKLYEDKHKKYKYKYAKLCKKVEEQEIEARCQQDTICKLKRVDDQVKDQKHLMLKYKKKIKSLAKERETLKGTLQKRNQTIIVLNKENSRLKKQIVSLQMVESVRYNSDDCQSDEIKDENKNELVMNKSTDSNGKDEASTIGNNTPMTTENNNNNKVKRNSLHIRHSNEISNDLINKLINNSDHSNSDLKETNDGYLIGETETVACAIVSDNENENENELINHNDINIQQINEKINQQINIEINNNNNKQKNNNTINTKKTPINYKKLYEKEKCRVSHYKCKQLSALKKYEKSEMELSINKHQFEELQQKYLIMEHSYKKLKEDLNKIMNRYTKLEIEYEKIQNTFSDNDLTSEQYSDSNNND